MNKVFNIINSIEQDDVIDFISHTKSNYNIKINNEALINDLSWIDVIESSLPFLDNIIRNPRKYIVNEEDILPVEKTKKVNTDAIKHLSQHTNFIQDIDEDGMVLPSKLLNVYKEETIDLYENRFIMSLLNNLKVFLASFDEVQEGYVNNKRILSYQGETKYKNESVKIKLDMESKINKKENKINGNEQSAIERLNNIKLSIQDFYNTNFIKGLRGASLVRSPIRKTNVILKDSNFQKAVELWEYLEKYQIIEPVIKKEQYDISNDEKIKNNFNLTYLINYNLLNDINNDTNNKINITKVYADRLIEEALKDPNHKEVDFKELINTEYKIVYKRKKRIDKDILNKFKLFKNKEEKRINKLFSYIK